MSYVCSPVESWSIFPFQLSEEALFASHGQCLVLSRGGGVHFNKLCGALLAKGDLAPPKVKSHKTQGSGHMLAGFALLS